MNDKLPRPDRDYFKSHLLPLYLLVEHSTSVSEVMSSVQAWIFFLPNIFTTAQVVFITVKIVSIFTSLSTVDIYDFHIFTIIYSSRVYVEHSDQLPVGLLAQLVEHSTSIAEIMGSNPVQTWIFFPGLIFTTA